MIEILYKKKLIRDFLSLFSQDKWSNIIVCLVEYSIIMMKKTNINPSLLSYEDLINLLEEFKIEMKIIDKPVLSKNNMKIGKSLSKSRSKGKSLNESKIIKKNSDSKSKLSLMNSNISSNYNKDSILKNSKNGLTISNKHELKNGNKSNLSSSPDIRDSVNTSPSFNNQTNLMSNKLSKNMKTGKFTNNSTNSHLKKEEKNKIKGAKNLYIRHLEKIESNVPGNIITLGSNSDKSLMYDKSNNAHNIKYRKDAKADSDIRNKTRNLSINQKNHLSQNSKSKSKFQALEIKQIEKLKQKRKDIEQNKSINKIVNDSFNNDYKFNMNNNTSHNLNLNHNHNNSHFEISSQYNLSNINSNNNSNLNNNVKSKIKDEIINDKKFYKLYKDKFSNDKFSVIEDLKSINKQNENDGSHKEKNNYLENSSINEESNNDISLRDKYSKIMNKKNQNQELMDNSNMNIQYGYKKKNDNEIDFSKNDELNENTSNPKNNDKVDKLKYYNQQEYEHYSNSNFGSYANSNINTNIKFEKEKVNVNVPTENSLKQYNVQIEEKNVDSEVKSSYYNKTHSDDNIINLVEIERNSDKFSKLVESRKSNDNENNITIKNEKIQQIINSKFNEYLIKIKKDKGIIYDSDKISINENEVNLNSLKSNNNIDGLNLNSNSNVLKQNNKDNIESDINMPLQSTLNMNKK